MYKSRVCQENNQNSTMQKREDGKVTRQGMPRRSTGRREQDRYDEVSTQCPALWHRGHYPFLDKVHWCHTGRSKKDGQRCGVLASVSSRINRLPVFLLELHEILSGGSEIGVAISCRAFRGLRPVINRAVFCQVIVIENHFSKMK